MINPAPFIKRGNASTGFTYVVIFPVGSVSDFSFSVGHTGVISVVTALNVESYKLRKNGSDAGAPFTVASGDIIQMADVVKIDSDRPARFIFKGAFSEQSYEITALTAVDNTRKHLFVVNYTDQTISVIDTQTDVIIDTITLPHTGSGDGYEFQCLAYRSADDFMYVFGLNRVCKIDANPDSDTFLNVYSIADEPNASSVLSNNTAFPWSSAVYDYVNDKMYLGTCQFQNLSTWDFAATSVVRDELPSLSNSNPVFIPNDNIFVYGYLGVMISGGAASGFTAVEGGAAAPSVKPCYVLGSDSIYTGRNSCKVVKASTLEQVNLIDTGVTGNSAYAQIIGTYAYGSDYGLVLCLTAELGIIPVIDTTTNEVVGTITRTNLDTNETIARSLVYGAFSKKFYFAGNGTSSPVSRVHKLNPQAWIDNGMEDVDDMIDGYITVGDMKITAGNTTFNAIRYAQYSMAFNHLIPC